MNNNVPRTVRLHPADNVIVCIDQVPAGLAVQGVSAAGRIPRGHKLATRPIARGEPVRKFGQIIGFASQDVAEGAHVHEHNCSMGDFERDYAFAEGNSWTPPRWTACRPHLTASAAGTANQAPATTSPC
jgi:altronate hydrolase